MILKHQRKASMETASARICHVLQLKLSQVFLIHEQFTGIKTVQAEKLPAAVEMRSANWKCSDKSTGVD